MADLSSCDAPALAMRPLHARSARGAPAATRRAHAPPPPPRTAVHLQRPSRRPARRPARAVAPLAPSVLPAAPRECATPPAVHHALPPHGCARRRAGR
eukprot:5034184-Prymnesium_polylepis.1